MADFSALKQSIQNYIKQNGNKEITGNLLQNILLSMVTTMGDGAINGNTSDISNLNGDLSDEINRAKGAETTTILFSDGKLVFKNAAGTVLYQLSIDSFLSAIITRLNAGALYAGYATPSTTPAALTSQEVFYLATQAGTYTNFHFNGGDDPIVLTKDGIYFIVSGSDDDDWNAEPMLLLDDVPTASSNNAVKSGGVAEELALGAVYDVSAKNPTAGPNDDGKWESLSALLDDANLNTLIPTSVRKGGMSVKFVSSVDNKYIQARCMAQNFTTDVTQWQGVDDEPTAGSDNLVKSGGVYEKNNELNQELQSIEKKKTIFDFPFEECVNDQGDIVPLTNTHRTNKIYISDNVTSIKYQGVLDAYHYVLAFFDENDNLLPSISIIGTSEIVGDTININANYSDAKYFIVSSYGNIANAKAIVNYNNTIEQIVDDLPDLYTKFKLAQQFCYKTDGTVYNSSYMRGTKVLSIETLCPIVKYGLALEAGYYIVTFLDKNYNTISELSIEGSGAASIVTGTIDFSDAQYANAKYIQFATYTGRLNTSFVENYNEELKIEEISASVSKDVALTVVSNANDALPQVIYPFKNSGLILYDNGALYTSGGYHTDNIPLGQITNIKVNFKNVDSSGAVIAFFDSSNHYIKDISVAGNSSNVVSLDITAEIKNKASYFIASTWTRNSNTSCIVNQFAITKPFLFGKKFCALGDSITDGDGNNSYSWYDMLLRRYAATEGSINNGVSGARLRTMADICTPENMANIDICFVMGGTNQESNYRLGAITDDATPDKWEKNKAYAIGDRVTGGTIQTDGTTAWFYLYWYECIAAGTSGNTEDASAFPTTTDETFTDGTVTWKCIGNPSWYSDMKRICNKVWGSNPSIRIIWFIPPKTKNDCAYTDPSQWARATKFQAIRDFCVAYSIQTIDLQKEFPLNVWTKDSIMADNLHPNEKGYKIIQDIVCSHIE